MLSQDICVSGIAVKTSLDNSSTVQYSSLVSGLAKQVKSISIFQQTHLETVLVLHSTYLIKSFEDLLGQARGMVRNIDPNNDLTFIRWVPELLIANCFQTLNSSGFVQGKMRF